MLIIEMVLLWGVLLCTILTVGAAKGGHELAAPLLLLTVTLITMYVTLIRYTPVIRDCVPLV